LLLSQQWKLLADSGWLPSFSDVEFSAHSQNGEDGILLFLFSLIGHGSKTAVEVCCGDAIECNAANLIINHGWNGLLFDGDQRLLAHGRNYYANSRSVFQFSRLPPTLIDAHITAENVNDLIARHGITGDIDLLSLDMDGVDFWIWKAIEVVSPRVVILEYNNRFASDQSLTIPYDPAFRIAEASIHADGYFGASLPAFVKLAKDKGYRLVGANSPNTNAVFIKNGTGENYFPEVAAESCLTSRYARHQHATKWPRISHMQFVTV
jgi:hypothetical protein